MNHDKGLALVDRLYRTHLVLYPRGFRDQYGPDIAQLFSDCSRQAQLERGWLGLALFWMTAVGDIAISTVGERISEAVRMFRPFVIRIAAWAAMAGGAVNLISLVTHPSGLARAAVPGSIILMMVGVIGLYVVLGRRGGQLRKIGLALLCTGLTLGVVGMAGSALGVLQPDPIAPLINTGEHAGLVFIAAGMVAWGVLAIRTRALGRWSLVPLGMGLLSLTGIAFVVPPAFAAVEAGAVPFVFAASWVLLGMALLTIRGAAPEGPELSGPQSALNPLDPPALLG